MCFLGTICLNGHKVLDGCVGATSAAVAAAARNLNGWETLLIAVVTMHVVVVRIDNRKGNVAAAAVKIGHGGIKVGIVIVTLIAVTI